MRYIEREPESRARRSQGWRAKSIWLVVLLALIVSAERRVADIKYTARVDAVAISNGDVLGGDAITIRLVALDDAASATPVESLGMAPAAVDELIVAAPRRPASLPFPLPRLRAPPQRVAA